MSAWVDDSTRPQRTDMAWTGLLWWVELDGPWIVQTKESLAAYAPPSFDGASKLAPLVGRRHASRAAYWAEVGALLSSSERQAFVSWVRDDRLPFTVVEARPVGFRADGWLGQYLVVYPDVGLVAVRQRRASEGSDAKENETYGWKELPRLVRRLVPR